jgi:hypothetical protein
MMHALLMQKGVFRRGCRAVNFCPAETRKLHSRQPHPATSPMNQHLLTGPPPPPKI